ncbi:hypothetical protein [Alicyclobacillus sp. ALC3]|uniref:hypothetical protein n=1 Tax=Alicyclobacillus sp. ALC3 TaxID=2796143 RepID=UPI002378ABA6|nr:hypothetical protein [Alicyclobacillus sp. ALC3]WDL98117.1 hypothetical protein JC200_05295 [Alicyclobacillus sp. ALC3]
MNAFLCKPGDLLFYFQADNVGEALIQTGEELEEHSDGPWPWHVAVALGPWTKVEADGKETAIHAIDYHNCVICRPPYESQRALHYALGWARRQRGRLYGWIGTIDQALRDISGGRLHLPRWFVTWTDKLMPYCSTLAQSITWRAGWRAVKAYPPPSPADMWKAAKKYIVHVCPKGA